jgi:rhodanese-related sulfurtransferase
MMESVEITCEDLKHRLDSGDALRIVDCREPWEHDLVRLADSGHIPMNDTPERVDEYRAFAETVIVYCHHGVRSLHVATWLRSQGVANVLSLRGGIDAWSLSIDPGLPRY